MVGIIVRGRESPHKDRQIERGVCSWVSAASALDAHWMRRTCEVQSVDMLSSSALACAPSLLLIHSNLFLFPNFSSTQSSIKPTVWRVHTHLASIVFLKWHNEPHFHSCCCTESEPCQEIENIKHAVLFWGEIIAALWALNILCCCSIWLQISDACIMAEVTILFPKSTH